MTILIIPDNLAVVSANGYKVSANGYNTDNLVIML
jgi:hypothetical protein